MNYLSAKFTLSEQGASVPLFTEGKLGTNHSGSNFDRLAFKQMLRNINIESSAVSEGQKVEVKWLEMF